MNRTEISAEMRHVDMDFARLVHDATPADLRKRSAGTQWTNRQLLFHMVFGYLIVRTLLPLVHVLGRRGRSAKFAATLNAAQRPFHLINYLGSAGGGQILSPRAMAVLLTWTLRALDRRLSTESEDDLALAMKFPTAWDPYFAETMTVLDVYRYGTQHYDHHRRQLTFPPTPESPAGRDSETRE